MATFYVLPVQSVVGDHLADCLHRLLPGLSWTSAARQRLAECVVELAALRDELYVVTREELPAGETVEQALIDGHGATTGDEIVEVRLTEAGTRTRRWRIGALAMAS